VSLRRRLVLGCVAVGLVLLVADLALASTFRSFLVGRVDRQLEEAVGRSLEPGPGGAGRGLRRQPTEFYVAVANEQGVVTVEAGGRFRRDAALAPDVTPEAVRDHTVARGAELEPFVASAPNGEQWRVVAVRSQGGATLLVGAPLGNVTATLRRMQVVLALATLAVLLTLGAVAAWVLRQGVRPLAAMTTTAEAIAGGALSERVTETDERTEAGRLGTALNTMLGRIESAFADRAASEDRLRRFVADASHELRTPLTSIRGYAELYRTGALADEQLLADAMRRVEGEALRMASLVDDLLLLARLDQGRELAREPVRLDSIARDAVADARAVAPEREVGLTAAPVTVVGDEDRLRQVVANLLANALRHTPDHAAVDVDVRMVDGRARLSVADSGPGLDAESASRVFERFYRADSSRASATGGSGLGLSIVQSVVAAHGGRVTLDTAPGEGARFVVELPAG
jgi:two-component system, OmpR family, sensor kinase